MRVAPSDVYMLDEDLPDDGLVEEDDDDEPEEVYKMDKGKGKPKK